MSTQTWHLTLVGSGNLVKFEVFKIFQARSLWLPFTKQSSSCWWQSVGIRHNTYDEYGGVIPPWIHDQILDDLHATIFNNSGIASEVTTTCACALPLASSCKTVLLSTTTWLSAIAWGIVGGNSTVSQLPSTQTSLPNLKQSDQMNPSIPQRKSYHSMTTVECPDFHEFQLELSLVY